MLNNFLSSRPQAEDLTNKRILKASMFNARTSDSEDDQLTPKLGLYLPLLPHLHAMSISPLTPDPLFWRDRYYIS